MPKPTFEHWKSRVSYYLHKGNKENNPIYGGYVTCGVTEDDMLVWWQNKTNIGDAVCRCRMVNLFSTKERKKIALGVYARMVNK